MKRISFSESGLDQPADDLEIIVCDCCLMASCLQGTFMCERAVYAGTTTRTFGELKRLGREHVDYMLVAWMEERHPKQGDAR